MNVQDVFANDAALVGRYRPGTQQLLSEVVGDDRDLKPDMLCPSIVFISRVLGISVRDFLRLVLLNGATCGRFKWLVTELLGDYDFRALCSKTGVRLDEDGMLDNCFVRPLELAGRRGDYYGAVNSAYRTALKKKGF